jgi:metal-responsive CopG/Arc/MetJ family transcriptional regulator
MARILVSMPDEFLSKIDAVAGNEQRTRSELVRKALRSCIRRTKLPSPQRAMSNAKILEEILG